MGKHKKERRKKEVITSTYSRYNILFNSEEDNKNKEYYLDLKKQDKGKLFVKNIKKGVENIEDLGETSIDIVSHISNNRNIYIYGGGLLYLANRILS